MKKVPSVEQVQDQQFEQRMRGAPCFTQFGRDSRSRE